MHEKKCRHGGGDKLSGLNGGVSCDTEFLSTSGWFRMDEYSGQQVCQYNPETEIGNYTFPSEYMKIKSDGVYNLLTKYGVDQIVGKNQRLLLYVPQKSKDYKQYVVVRAKDFVDKNNSLVCGHTYRFNTSFSIERESFSPLSDEDIRVKIMTSADGTVIADGSTIVLTVKKQRKIDRAKITLKNASKSYLLPKPDGKGFSSFRYAMPPDSKKLSPLWDCSYNQLCVILDEIFHWDGNIEGRGFYTGVKEHADFISYVFAATGNRSVMTSYKRPERNIEYAVFARQNTKISVASNKATIFLPKDNQDGFEYNFVLPTGFFVIRHGGNVSITGSHIP